tara:strand:+ start:144 stop:563 length:420 start_codon:yes stop_codon:yes gene_type:complete
MKYLLIVLALVSPALMASGTLKEVSLSPELAEKLGFTIIVKPESAVTMIELIGPNESPSGCAAKRSGSYLLGKEGEELFVYITELPQTDVKPQALGYYSNKEHTMGVFIDYLCSGTQTLKSIRYAVPSISNWLITKPSN